MPPRMVCTRATSTWSNRFHLVEPRPPVRRAGFRAWVRNWRTVTGEVRTGGFEDRPLVWRHRPEPTEARTRELFGECYHCYPGAHEVLFVRAPELRNPDVSTARPARPHRHRVGEMDGKPLQSKQGREPRLPASQRIGAAATRHWRPAGEPRSQHERIGRRPRQPHEAWLPHRKHGRQTALAAVPTRNDWSHYYQAASVGFLDVVSKAYDDHVVGCASRRATSIRPMPSCSGSSIPMRKRQGLRRQRIQALWGNTYREEVDGFCGNPAHGRALGVG